MADFTVDPEESHASQPMDWPPEIKLTEVAECSFSIEGDFYRLDYPPSQQPERMVLTRGSVNHLSDQEFFWSGHTLEDLYFNDRQPCRLENNIPYAHEDLPRTTIQDIVEIFNISAPPVFRPHQGPSLCPSALGNWYLAYLDGTEHNALEFRTAVLDSFPPPSPAESPEGSYCISLEIFCLGILPEIRSQLEECPTVARVLAMIRPDYAPTSDASHFIFYGA